jgi:hypothetical protein
VGYVAAAISANGLFETKIRAFAALEKRLVANSVGRIRTRDTSNFIEGIF